MIKLIWEVYNCYVFYYLYYRLESVYVFFESWICFKSIDYLKILNGE